MGPTSENYPRSDLRLTTFITNDINMLRKKNAIDFKIKKLIYGKTFHEDI